MTVTLTELTQEYMAYLKQAGKSERTLYTYGKDIELIVNYFGPDKHLAQLTLPIIGKFTKSDHLWALPNGKFRSPITVHKTIRVFRMFLFWAKEQGHIQEVLLPKDIPLGINTPSS